MPEAQKQGLGIADLIGDKRDQVLPFVADDRTQYAVVRAYEIIGEAVKGVPAEVIAFYPDIE
jgi:uncharacterized protein with HEPN domain